MTHMNTSRFAVATVLIALFAAPSPADNWPRFRGPNGSGVSDIAIPAQWDEKTIAWRIDLPGKGHGSPVVWGKRVFLNDASDDGSERRLMCIDGDSGKVLWTKTYKSAKHDKHRNNSFASVTPAVDATRVVTSWADGGRIMVVALDHDGKELWDRDAGPVVGDHGFGVSPTLVGDLLVLPNDQNGKSSLLGLDANTGETRWTVPRKSKRMTYSVPCVFEPNGGASQLIFSNWEHGVTSVDPKTGNVNWELDVFGKPSPERAIGSPIVAGDLVIANCGFFSKARHVVAIRPSDPPRLAEAKEVWRVERNVPHVPTVLVKDELVYMCDDGGVLNVVKLATGEEVYKQRLEGVKGKVYSSAVAAGETIFIITTEGQVYAVATGDTFKLLGTYALEDNCQSTPAIANGAMYVRTLTLLLCVRGSQRQN